jgi:hypothetical protein
MKQADLDVNQTPIAPVTFLCKDQRLQCLHINDYDTNMEVDAKVDTRETVASNYGIEILVTADCNIDT